MPIAEGSVNSTTTDRPIDGSEVQSLTTVVGEQLCSDYGVHELPTDAGDITTETSPVSAVPSDESSVQDLSTSLLSSEGNPSNTEALVNLALLARIQMLEAESSQLKAKLAAKKLEHFRIEQIQHDDKLFNFYMGFVFYEVFLAFYEFLGPVVNELNYWDSKKEVQRHYKCKLNPVNQLFLIMVKLRLGLKSKDLAF